MKKTTTRRSNGVTIGEFKRPGSNELLASTRTGQLNAGSNEELIASIITLLNAQSNGSLVTEEASAEQLTPAQRNADVASVYRDRSGSAWAELGARIGGELSITANREGFMRRLLQRSDLETGQTPRVRVKQRNVLGVVASDIGALAPQYLRDNYLLPPEFYISANLRVEERELLQGTGDILEEKFFEGNEAIMVQEDRTWKRMADALTGVVNPQQLLTGGLTPNNLGTMSNLITRWNLPVSTLLIASDVLQDFTGSNWSDALDPVSQYEILLTGVIGKIHGMSIVTDAHREPVQKVLDSGEVYVVSSPEYHGAYTDRGPVNSTPVDSYPEGIPARGWYMYELMSMVVANARSVVRGVRS